MSNRGLPGKGDLRKHHMGALKKRAVRQIRKRLVLIHILLIVLICFFGFPASSWAEMQQVTWIKGSIREITYVDSNGAPASNAKVGYATVRQLLDEQQRVVSESYFDAQGVPTVHAQGYYSLTRVYKADGRCIQCTYLDAEGSPVLIRGGYAGFHRSYDDQTGYVTDTYFDTDGKPISLPNGQYGIRREQFDEAGRTTCFTYLDADGMPMQLQAGYAGVIRSYTSTGLNEQDMYFDIQHKLVCMSLGEYGRRYTYDDLGRISAITYLDADAQPFINTHGYATLKQQYDAQGRISHKWYYGLDGQPVALSRGQYGQRLIYQGSQQVDAVYVDRNGHDLFFIDQYLETRWPLTVVLVVLLLALTFKLPKSWLTSFMVCYVGFILYITLYIRPSGVRQFRIDLLWSYRQFFTSITLQNQIINNILLMIPFGAMLCEIWPKRLILLIPLLLSVLIELIQYFFKLGLCDLDDILSNSIGGTIGWLIVANVLSLTSKRRSQQNKQE